MKRLLLNFIRSSQRDLNTWKAISWTCTTILPKFVSEKKIKNNRYVDRAKYKGINFGAKMQNLYNILENFETEKTIEFFLQN